MRVLIVDNYDSFVYNLYQYVGELGADPVVVRHDAIDPDKPPRADRIIISPGPGRPEESVGGLAILHRLASEIPTLGVCLGHQLIGQFFGARVTHAPKVMHGKTSTITHDGQGIYRGLPATITVTRYHSLAVEPDGLSKDVVITSRSEDGVVMGIRHRHLPIEGVQFHPESVMTEHGHQMIANFLFS
jgi:anthranilate synthase/aminodeoxychorismate synthase-like glutamine amidotransferase